jgi:DNA modification methylase
MIALDAPAIRNEAHGENWSLLCGDSCEVLPLLPSKSVHLAVFSPPFSSLYAYSPSERDLGNVATREEFFEHHRFIACELLRLMVPGRVVAAHTYEIQEYATSHASGRRGRYDFPGDYIRHMEDVGFRWVCRITIDKNPQTQAIRNHPLELLFASLRRDSARCAPAQADYLLIFQAPGENPIPVQGDVTEDEWVQWARPVWCAEHGSAVRETDCLPDAGSKENDDERHLCPLQLPVIERCVRLWTNPGETVLDPFSGIGSTVYKSVQLGRRGVGIELKGAYRDVAVRFCRQAEAASKQRDLFSVLDEMNDQGEHRSGCGFYEAQAGGMDRPWGACDCGLVNHDDD